jgi:ribosomal-protein-alanine N-acetyltransferase
MLPTDPPFKPEVKTLETERLSIRIDTVEDYVEKFKTSTDAELKERFGIRTDEELRKQKDKVSGGFTTHRTNVVFFHFIERRSGKVIGNLAFHNWFPMHRRSEIGYAMAADEYKNRGYMREAIAPIIAFGFQSMELNRIEAFIHPDNGPSRKLVERAGFKQEGWLREHYKADGVVGDSIVYGLLRSEYSS